MDNLLRDLSSLGVNGIRVKLEIIVICTRPHIISEDVPVKVIFSKLESKEGSIDHLDIIEAIKKMTLS